MKKDAFKDLIKESLREVLREPEFSNNNMKKENNENYEIVKSDLREKYLNFLNEEKSTFTTQSFRGPLVKDSGPQSAGNEILPDGEVSLDMIVNLMKPSR